MSGVLIGSSSFFFGTGFSRGSTVSGYGSRAVRPMSARCVGSEKTSASRSCAHRVACARAARQWCGLCVSVCARARASAAGVFARVLLVSGMLSLARNRFEQMGVS